MSVVTVDAVSFFGFDNDFLVLGLFYKNGFCMSIKMGLQKSRICIISLSVKKATELIL
jgi:hypothetical protein